MSRSYSASMRRKFWRLVMAIACLETRRSQRQRRRTIGRTIPASICWGPDVA
jgi:hypothetical protein